MKVQHFFQNNKYLFLAGAIMLTVAWVSVTIAYIAHYVHKLQMSHVELVELRAPAPTMNVPKASTAKHGNATITMPTTQKRDHWLGLPTATMTSTTGQLIETSNTTVSHIGGGMAPAVAATQTGGSSSGSRGIAMNNASYNFTGMIHLTTAHSAVTSVGAPQANEVVNEKMGLVERHEATTDFPEENDGPLDPIDPTPVGDVAWWMVTLLAAAYGISLYRRKEQTI